MLAPETAKPALDGTGNGLQDCELLGGWFDKPSTTNTGTIQESLDRPGDPRLLGVGWGECERALLDCQPVVLNDRLYAELFARGIFGDGVNGRGPFDALAYDVVVFLPGGRFEFARNMRDTTGSKLAVIVAAHDEDDEFADLAAFDLESGTLALWRGVVAMMGEDQLAAPRIDSPVLDAFPDVLSWLRNNRSGVVIIDPARARWRLAGDWLAVSNAGFGARLREELRLPEPQIFVRTAA